MVEAKVALRTSISEIKTKLLEPGGIESMIREGRTPQRIGMTRKGQVVYVVPPEGIKLGDKPQFSGEWDPMIIGSLPSSVAYFSPQGERRGSGTFIGLTREESESIDTRIKANSLSTSPN